MYKASIDRYNKMIYRRVGNSGLKLSAIGLGFWHNFGSVDSFENQKAIVHEAFDLGITYYDLANNYGPIPGSAEEDFGRIMAADMKPYRDEMIISSKAGYRMWDGPYGNGSSRKSIIASADQSLMRLGLDYVDIFYSHRFDRETPLVETAEALDQLVKEGKALYIGISNYNTEQTKAIIKIFTELHTPFVVNQPCYNMFDRHIEKGLLSLLKKEHKGAICFSALAQGLLTDRYLNGIPSDSRAAKSTSHFLTITDVKKVMPIVKNLNMVAKKRGQSLADMALAWNLRWPEIACVLVGASRPSQLAENVKALKNLEFSKEELAQIDQILTDR